MSDERLSEYFGKFYDYLTEQGVPEDRLPNPWQVLSHVLDCVDQEKLSGWLDAYSAIEGGLFDDEENDEEYTPPRPRKDFLRALPVPPSENGES